MKEPELETAENMVAKMAEALASNDAGKIYCEERRQDAIIVCETARQQPIKIKLEYESRIKALKTVSDMVTRTSEKIQKKGVQMKNNINIKYQIFIGSTYEDLKDERECIIWEILKSENIPVGMENFSASNDRGWDTIQKTIDSSDIYILLLAGRYGSIDEETKLGWTEKEYDYVKEKGIPVLIFIREDNSITANHLDTDFKKEKLDLFKTKVSGITGHLKENWETKNDLATKVIHAIIKQIKIFEKDFENSHGWYRHIEGRGNNEKT
ncbi:hypothetical protein AGMMS50212_02520 [Spirochaetia bacterium]|nr:hypothetical protein AGMMS50212_02520 [Spirochaetia bacterium]